MPLVTSTDIFLATERRIDVRRYIWRIFFAFVALLATREASAQWQTTCQPNAVNSVVAAGPDLYVNNDGTNIWLSPDSGSTWTAILGGSQAGSALITALIVNSGTLYVGTEGAGVYTSTDNGKSWTSSDNGLPSSSSNTVTTFYALGDTVFVASSDLGVFRTVDGGLSWTEADSGLPDVTLNQVSAITGIGSTLVAASTKGYDNIGIFESTDYGKYWNLVLNEPGTAMNPGGMSSGGGNLLLSLENTSNFTFSLLISTNGGTLWVPDTAATSGFPPGVQVNTFASTGSDVYVGTETSGIFRSTDGGIHWAQTNNGLIGYTQIVNSMAIQGSDLFAECNGNLFSSTNGGNNWQLITNGIPGDTLSNKVDIDFDRSVYSYAQTGSRLFAGVSGNGVCVSTDSGKTWSAVSNGLPYPSDGDAITAVGNSTLVAGTGGSFVTGTIYRSTDNGASWTNVNNGISVNTGVNRLVSIGSTVFAATSSGGYISTDGGADWAAAGNIPAATLNAAFQQDSTFFAGGNSTGVLRSSDGGTQWTVAGSGIPTNATVSSIGGDGTNVFAATSGGLYRSSDDGITWARSDSGLPAGTSVAGGYVSGQQGNVVLVATAGSSVLGSVFLSTDGGATWSQLNEGMLPTSINSVFADAGKVYVGAGNGSGGGPWGVWYWQLPAGTSGGTPPPSELAVDSVSPSNGAVNLPLQTTLSITFDAPLDTTIHLARGLPIFMLTNIDSIGPVTWSDGLRTVSATAIFHPNTVYTTAILAAYGEGGLRLGSPYIVRFTTGSRMPPDSVSGMVLSGTTVVSPDSAVVGLAMTPDPENLTSLPPLIAIANTDSSGNFSIPDVPNGTYYPVAAKDVDGDGVINPLAGKDVVAIGTPITVNNANVTGVELTWTSFKPVNWKQGLSISDSLFLSLPAHCVMRFVSGLDVDTSGNSMEWVTGVTNTITKSGYLVTAGAVSTVLPMDSTSYDSLSAFTAFAPDTAANAGIFVGDAENAGGRAFLRQEISEGDSVYILLYLGELKRTQFGLLAPDSGLYWGAQYVALNPRALLPVTTEMFIGDFRTGAILFTTGVQSRLQAVPKSFALEQNYPNPFNPTTVISYQLSAVSNVTLDVYDILGREVATLVNEKQSAGNYSVTFDGSRLASGVYFYRLVAGNYTSTKKLVLVK